MDKNLIRITDLHEHMNLSYKTLSENIVGIDLNRSLINGSKINNIIIRNTNLQLTEWSGTIAESVEYEGCDFSYAEFKSVWFKNCMISNCNFKDSIISDCTFNECVFINCNFEGAFFQENTFNKCSFNKLTFIESSANLNVFDNCNFTKVGICGSFYYSVFKNCNIDYCEVDEYLLGYILGFFSSETNDVVFLRRNQPLNDDIDEIVNNVIQQYEERLKFVNIAILKLNLNEINNIDKLMLACIQAFVYCFNNDIAVNLDDIKFINYVIEMYYNEHTISPCMIFEASSLVQNALNNADFYSNKKQLKQLFSSLFFCQQDYLMNLKDIATINKTSEYVLFIRYEEEPEVSLLNIIKTLSNKHFIEPKILKTQKGSFLQWLSCDGNASLLVSILFGFLNIGVPIVYDVIKERKKEKKHKEKTNRDNIENIVVSKEDKSNNITINLSSVNDSFLNCNSVINAINIFNLKVSNDFMGYNNENIKEITFTEQ